MQLIIGSAAALVVGGVLGYYARQVIAKKQAGTLEAKLNKLVEDSKNEASKTLLEAKEKSVAILEEAKKEERERKDYLQKNEQRLEHKEQLLERREGELAEQEKELELKVSKVKQVKEDLQKLQSQKISELEKIALLSRDEAKAELLSQIEKENQEVIMERVKRLEKENQEELEKKAKDIMVLAMQRYASSQVSEVGTSTVALPSEDLKGRIIGKEGRNIKTLEKLTGVEIIIDDVPDAIVISAFDPVRRQIAKISLEKLIADGRIQPARIEEAVEKAKEEIGQKIQEAGEAAVYDTGVAGLDPKLVKILGRLRFRTSYGQNVLLHSIEVAHLAGMIASELGANTSLAKKAGLLHDIGKAVDHEIQGSHVEIGRMLLKKFNLPEEIIQTMESHHEEYPYANVESRIVQVADALSSARPGARKDTLEAYLKRLEELEQIANSFEGVEKTYAIQAGREIRVFVKPEEIDDLAARELARKIADKIQEDLNYPGEIKISVIRETRVVEYAR